jgi:hypothetical protein
MLTSTHRRSLVAGAIVVSAVGWASGSAAKPQPLPRPEVRPTAPMSVARAAHSTALLPSGRVLVAGGCTLPGCHVEGFTGTAEIYDPRSRRFTATGSMRRMRNNGLAQTLRSGDVLIAGGYSGTEPTASVELYDEQSGTFRPAESLLGPRADGTATRLPDGRILFAGGDDGEQVLASAEIYDPATGRFHATGSMAAPRKIHTATLLRDGRVLVAGGATTGGRVVRTAELYDPRTGTFAPTGALARIRYNHGAARLPDGRVLIIAGASRFDLGARYRHTEVYDPRTGRFTPGRPLASSRFRIADAVVGLASGRILVAGDSPQLELYEPTRRRFRAAGRIGLELAFSTAVRLRDGSVLIVGGYSSLGDNPVRRAWTFRLRG